MENARVVLQEQERVNHNRRKLGCSRMVSRVGLGTVGSASWGCAVRDSVSVVRDRISVLRRRSVRVSGETAITVQQGRDHATRRLRTPALRRDSHVGLVC
jgi:hypothetical protein